MDKELFKSIIYLLKIFDKKHTNILESYTNDSGDLLSVFCLTKMDATSHPNQCFYLYKGIWDIKIPKVELYDLKRMADLDLEIMMLYIRTGEDHLFGDVTFHNHRNKLVFKSETKYALKESELYETIQNVLKFEPFGFNEFLNKNLEIYRTLLADLILKLI